MGRPRVAIMYLVWSEEPFAYLENALEGVVKQTYPRESLELYIIYNSHRPHEQSALSYIHDTVARYQHNLPFTKILAQEKNLGFTGGNNAGIQAALAGGAEYIFLHNADGFLAPEAIEKQVSAFLSDSAIAQVQSLILLQPENDRINTAGNAWHYMGFGYCTKYREPVSELNTSSIYDIGYASGAATMLRADLIRRYGALNDRLFLYHEDTEYSLRLLIRGFRVVAARESIFYHRYSFSKGVGKYFWLERNRHIVNYLFYRWPTLIMLAPLELAYNVGLLVVAIHGGWLRELFMSYAYWFRPSSWREWRSVRRANQNERTIADRMLIRKAARRVDTAYLVAPRLLSQAANALFTFYYFLLILVVWW